MLTAQPIRQNPPGFFSNERRYDIFDNGRPVGGLTFDRRTGLGAFTVHGAACTVDRLTDQPAERVYRALIRVAKGGEKVPANPWALRHASARVLALAEPASKTGALDPVFVVRSGEKCFTFRQPAYSVVFRPYHLYPEGGDVSLGSVGGPNIFTRTLNIDLPDALEAPFQLFLRVLLLHKVQE